MKIHLRFRLAVFVISLSCSCVTPLFAQVCSKDSQVNLGNNNEEYPPTQRVASVRSDRTLSLAWALPAEFTAIEPFIGKEYQLAQQDRKSVV